MRRTGALAAPVAVEAFAVVLRADEAVLAGFEVEAVVRLADAGFAVAAGFVALLRVAAGLVTAGLAALRRVAGIFDRAVPASAFPVAVFAGAFVAAGFAAVGFAAGALVAAGFRAACFEADVPCLAPALAAAVRVDADTGEADFEELAGLDRAPVPVVVLVDEDRLAGFLVAAGLAAAGALSPAARPLVVLLADALVVRGFDSAALVAAGFAEDAFAAEGLLPKLVAAGFLRVAGLRGALAGAGFLSPLLLSFVIVQAPDLKVFLGE